MEDKLAEYRRKKKAESSSVKTDQRSLFQSFTSIFQTTSVKEEDTTSERPVKLIKKESDSEPEEDLLPSDEELEVQWSGIDLFILAVKLSLWIALWGVAIKWEIGVCFVVLSGFVFIYLNLSDRKKRPKEKSAYSVFNKECRPLDGALKAEHFEKMIGKS
uniref:Putative LOC100181778 [Ciona intestinalis] n=1 Tax=Lepeophtheirus salmonis TaxID=72036 RepID=A0A0K2V1T5_LEPSM